MTSRQNILMMGYGGFTALACILMCVALGAPHWMESSNGYAGLFRTCIQGGRCFTYSDYTNGVDDLGDIDLEAGLCVTAILLYGLTVLIMGHLFIFQKMQTRSKTHGYLTLCVSIVAGILAWSGIGHYVNRVYDVTDSVNASPESWNFGYCPYLAGISTAFIIIAGMSSVMTLQAVVTRPMLPASTSPNPVTQGHAPPMYPAAIPMGTQPVTMHYGHQGYVIQPPPPYFQPPQQTQLQQHQQQQQQPPLYYAQQPSPYVGQPQPQPQPQPQQQQPYVEKPQKELQ